MSRRRGHKNNQPNRPSIGSRQQTRRGHAGINEVSRSLRPSSALTKRAEQVYAQTQKCQVEDEVVMNSELARYGYRSPVGIGSNGQMQSISPPSRGITSDCKKRTTVTCGSAGFGFLVISHLNTGFGNSASVNGLGNMSAQSHNGLDMLISQSTYAADHLDLSLFNPGSTPAGLVAQGSCVNTAFSYDATRRAGECMVAVLGQTVRLVGNPQSVSTRRGTIYSMNTPSVPPLLNTSLGDYARCVTSDAADLTQDAEIIVRRPTLSCGRWYDPQLNSLAWGSGAGQIPNSGWTIITIQADASAQFVFEITTNLVYAGYGVPPQIPICYDPMAYNTVACGRAKATGGSFITNARDASKTGTIARRAMHAATAQAVPGYLHDSLWDVGGKLLGKMAPYITGVLGL